MKSAVSYMRVVTVILNGFVRLIGLKSDLLRSRSYSRFSLSIKQKFFHFVRLI